MREGGYRNFFFAQISLAYTARREGKKWGGGGSGGKSNFKSMDNIPPVRIYYITIETTYITKPLASLPHIYKYITYLKILTYISNPLRQRLLSYHAMNAGSRYSPRPPPLLSSPVSSREIKGV